jgi:transcriptional regulator with XRE-family HTH domain
MPGGAIKDPAITARLSRKLISLRKSLRISQRAMSRLVGLSPVQWRSYEVKESDPGLVVLIRIADHFGLTLDELVGRKRRT